jgi:hypothetical protein
MTSFFLMLLMAFQIFKTWRERGRLGKIRIPIFYLAPVSMAAAKTGKSSATDRIACR